jgi:hypothetical protein
METPLVYERLYAGSCDTLRRANSLPQFGHRFFISAEQREQKVHSYARMKASPSGASPLLHFGRLVFICSANVAPCPSFAFRVNWVASIPEILALFKATLRKPMESA